MKVKITNTGTFQRYEKKYLLTARQYQGLSAALKNYMEPDEYGLHIICSIYYDTDDYAVIRESLTKPSFKQKLRLRSYGVPTADSIVYLELKKKLDGITYKRRIPLKLREAQDYMETGRMPEQQDQIFREIRWYNRQQPLSAKAVICYNRVALCGNDDANLRLTIDNQIRWRSYNLSLAAGDHGDLLLSPGLRLMEIKTMNALPLWLVKLLSQFKIYPCAFSKYGTVYQKYLAERAVIRHVG